MSDDDKFNLSNYDTDDGEIISKEAINFVLETLEDYEDDFAVITVDEYKSLLESHMNLQAHAEAIGD